jgi:predicted transcriptional regulator
MNRPQENLNLMTLTADVYATLVQCAQKDTGLGARVDGSVKPAVKVDDSVKPDYLICLEDGKRVKMLKRYLKTNFNLTPDEYKRRWSLPASYPMVAPNYAKVRSRLAKEIGLGKRGMPAAAAKRLNMVSASR